MRFWIGIILLFISHAIYAHTDQRFQQALDTFRDNQHVTSATLTISYPNSTEHYMSGEVASGSKEPVTENHLFQAASITKSFISTIVLNLQLQGLLHLDDPIENYLPEYTQWRGVTIRQLLNHTSGIYNFTDQPTFRTYFFAHPYNYLSADELISYAANEPVYFKAGMGWHYSNTNYVLLGKIIERIEARPIDEVLDSFIHKGLSFKLDNTFFVKHTYNDAIKYRMMHGYYQVSQDNTKDVTDYSMSWLNSAGGIVSNGSDLTVWIRALFTGQVFKNESFNEFTQLVSMETGQPVKRVNEATPLAYGLGIVAWQSPWKNVDIIWWHSGGSTGYKTLMMWLPKQQTAIVISYTQVIAGKENVRFDPTTDFAQTILKIATSN